MESSILEREFEEIQNNQIYNQNLSQDHYYRFQLLQDSNFQYSEQTRDNSMISQQQKLLTYKKKGKWIVTLINRALRNIRIDEEEQKEDEQYNLQLNLLKRALKDRQHLYSTCEEKLTLICKEQECIPQQHDFIHQQIDIQIRKLKEQITLLYKRIEKMKVVVQLLESIKKQEPKEALRVEKVQKVQKVEKLIKKVDYQAQRNKKRGRNFNMRSIDKPVIKPQTQRDQSQLIVQKIQEPSSSQKKQLKFFIRELSKIKQSGKPTFKQVFCPEILKKKPKNIKKKK